MATKGGESGKRRENKELLVIVDEEERPVGRGFTITCYLTEGMANHALARAKQRHPDKQLKIAPYIPQSSRLVFMDGD